MHPNDGRIARARTIPEPETVAERRARMEAEREANRARWRGEAPEREKARFGRHQALIPMGERPTISPAEKIERLSGYSLDRCEEILIQPLALVLQHPQGALILNAQVQIVRAIFHTMTKAGMSTERLAREREQILEGMMRQEFGAETSAEAAEGPGEDGG